LIRVWRMCRRSTIYMYRSGRLIERLKRGSNERQRPLQATEMKGITRQWCMRTVEQLRGWEP